MTHLVTLLVALVGAVHALPARGQATEAAPAHPVGLENGAVAFAGAAVAVDPRLAGRTCQGGYRYAWGDPAGRSVLALCGANGERLVLPLRPAGNAPSAQTRVRRGDPVVAEVQGAGFRATVNAVAAGPEKGDGLLVRNSRSGSTFLGQLGPDGRLRVASTSE